MKEKEIIGKTNTRGNKKATHTNIVCVRLLISKKNNKGGGRGGGGTKTDRSNKQASGRVGEVAG